MPGRRAAGAALCFCTTVPPRGYRPCSCCMPHPGMRCSLPRNAHLSAVNGCILGDLRPVFMPLTFTGDGDWISAGGKTVLDALATHPEARCLLVTRPDYYGGCLPLGRIAAAARKQGCRLVVDEAHGARLPWLPGLTGAAQAGADAWVQSCSTKRCPALQARRCCTCGTRRTGRGRCGCCA